MTSHPRDNGQHTQSPLRVWLRMLVATNTVLGRLRRSLREEFDITMPAFDLLVQVHRPPQGPTMRELSDRLMVSKGNVTDLVNRLEQKGLIERVPDPYDGRAQRVHLTLAGQELVERLEPAHQDWLNQMTANTAPATLAELYRLLGEFKAGLSSTDPGRKGRRQTPQQENT